MTGHRVHCPACSAPITVWDVVKAPLPSRVRCAACRVRLGFDADLVAITALAALVFALVIWLARPLYAALAGSGVITAAILSAVAALSLWLAFELLLARYLLHRRHVHVRDD
jgi:prepilin signal peptidase PulO-like enzyme (type II secretory pathway)